MTDKFLGVVLLLAFPLTAWAQEEATPALPALPELQSTVPKVKALGEGLERLKQLEATLKNLGSPGKKEAGESAQEYLQRVDRILKGRAYAITLMGAEIERLLDAKYQLQEELAKYEEWAQAVDKFLQVLPEDQRQKSRQLEEEFAALRPDGIVLASLIHQQLVQEQPEQAQDYATHFQTKLADGRTLLETVSDRSEREAKYASLSLEEQQAKFEEIVQAMVDKEFEIELLNRVVIVESQGLQEHLGDAHKKVIADAKVLLSNDALKALDDKAAQLSILAKYSAQNLFLVQPNGGLEGVIKVAGGLQTSEPVVEEVMKEIFTNQLSKSGRRNIMLRTAPALPPAGQVSP